jgi:FtsH-binding integral membrane protein
MKFRIVLVLALMFSLSPLAQAQDYRMEVTPFFGYTFSTGVAGVSRPMFWPVSRSP